jgi:hypothetical protein
MPNPNHKGSKQKLPRPFDRRVIDTGTSALVPLTTVLPSHWNDVRITPLEITQNHVIIKIQQLKRVVTSARTTPLNPRNKQNP